MLKRIDGDNRRRAVAGAWFAMASGIPLIPVWFESHPWTPGASVWYTLALKIFLVGILPVSIAGAVGYSLGASILDSSQTPTAKSAMMRGIEIALWAFALFAPLFSLIAAIHLSIYERAPDSMLVVELLKSFIGALLMVSLAGVIILGWLMTLVGAAAGWLLYKLRPAFRIRV